MRRINTIPAIDHRGPVLVAFLVGLTLGNAWRWIAW